MRKTPEKNDDDDVEIETAPTADVETILPVKALHPIAAALSEKLYTKEASQDPPANNNNNQLFEQDYPSDPNETDQVSRTKASLSHDVIYVKRFKTFHSFVNLKRFWSHNIKIVTISEYLIWGETQIKLHNRSDIARYHKVSTIILCK